MRLYGKEELKRRLDSAAAHGRLSHAVLIHGEQGAGMLTLTSSSVSRTHCELFIQNGRMIVRDLGSSNGTWLNGKRLESNRDASVKPGDRLEIGSKKERFEVQ